VPFPGDNIWKSFGAVYDPNFGNVSQGDPAYDALYNNYSGILISGGPNGLLNSAIETKTYLDPNGMVAKSGAPPAMNKNDDIWVYINKNEVMANFASSGNISRASDSGQNVVVNTGLSINFQFPGNPDFEGVEYTVIAMAFIYADQSQPYNFKVKMFPNINYPITFLNEDRIHIGFTKENLQRGDSLSTEQVYVPLGKCHIYALIEANNKAKNGKPDFPHGCEPSMTDDPQWALSHQGRWGKYFAINTNASNEQYAYGVFYTPLDIDSGSGSYTVTIPVSLATVPSPI
jgi:hypothetical protein